MSIEKH